MTNKDEILEEIVELDLNKIKSLIPQYSSEKLCEIIVCDRYFNMNQEITVMCMSELAIRRINGDMFQFEQYIDEALAKLPPLNFSMPDLRTTLNSLVKKSK